MLFVRCKGGVSHHPDEAITEADAVLSAQVLLRYIEQFNPALAGDGNAVRVGA
jgi:acetylornithine deacetylase/succinyl-diaminopimelate desuccinylase-like protein